jgi:metal-responsive CopG/Arc/MetJ family transcriptional regulator
MDAKEYVPIHITLEKELLDHIDRKAKALFNSNRSRAIADLIARDRNTPSVRRNGY